MASSPSAPPQTQASPATQLRQLLLDHFGKDDLATLCFDLGLDYDSLPGEGTAAKVVSLIEHFARAGRIKALTELCAARRPNADWRSVLSAAQNPAAFQFDAVQLPISKDVVNLPPNRALKLGFAAGMVAVLLVVCGFGGGLAASNLIDVTINPTPVVPKSLDDIKITINRRDTTPGKLGLPATEVFTQMANKLDPGTSSSIELNNIQVTTLADQLVKTKGSPISEVHIQAIEGNKVTLNVRVPALGNRRVLVAYTAVTAGGRIVIKPESAWLNVVEIPNSTFGWAPLPIRSINAATQWMQTQLDDAASRYWFEDIRFSKDKILVRGRTI